MPIFWIAASGLALSLIAGYGASLYFTADALSRGLGMGAATLLAIASITSAFYYLWQERRRDKQPNAVAGAICALVVIFLDGGVLAILMTPNWLPAFFWALASLLGGGLLGLLLALPVADDSDAAQPIEGETEKMKAKKKHVSALSKATSRLNAIIGGGIAFDWKEVYAEIKRIAGLIGESAGGQGVLGGGILLYFGLLGLVTGILLTRIFLVRYLEDEAT